MIAGDGSALQRLSVTLHPTIGGERKTGPARCRGDCLSARLQDVRPKRPVRYYVATVLVAK